jgi:hypothetical protein
MTCPNILLGIGGESALRRKHSLDSQAVPYLYTFIALFSQARHIRLSLIISTHFFKVLERWDGAMWTGKVWLRIGIGGELL